jgi:hypothetical protein
MSSDTTGFAKADHAHLTNLMLQRHLSHLNGRNLVTTAKFKPLVFSMSGLSLSYTANMSILMMRMISACCLHNFVV